ncbi:NAC transcription factor 29 isoform X1 [Olea europaea subsp. europaea]|uniref:NAC transcription factor 29 isoform X1 n=1 Tax=Olea europaea subsp. europaea TaxID=158383 RepID=A0A8S0TUK7_OLEEU|nr:NAC transcription factor 29 isoform X1 [Olea europaea subsp. europaea]
MCPPMPSPLFEIGSSDEQIILSLDEYIRGSPLPSNVKADMNPYQYNPSDLPVEFWYLIHSNEKKEFAFGFWTAKGETHEIYLNSELSGQKTTLKFFEGQAPNERRTGWLSQEYRITQRGLCHKTEQKDFKSLCRIFLSSAHSPKNDIQPKDREIDDSEKCIDSLASVNPNTNNSSAQDSSSKSEVKVLNSFPDDFAEQDCFLRGDFLELDDLTELKSLSSSSENSSCPSRASDEYFDSLALLRDLNDGDDKLQGEDSIQYRFSASIRPNKVVMKPATLESIQSGTGNKLTVEGFLTGSAPDPRFPEQFQEHANERQKSDHRIEGTSTFLDAAKPSASQKAESPGERKAVVGRMKRLKEILCFKPF